MRNPRLLVAAGVVLLAAAVGAVLLASPGGDPGAGDATATATTTAPPPPVVRATLTLEQFERLDTGARELLVSLPGPQFNSAELADDEQQVLLRCFDGDGARVIVAAVDWPLVEEPGYPPHIHQAESPEVLDGVRRCRVTGRSIDYEGRVSGRLPVTG